MTNLPDTARRLWFSMTDAVTVQGRVVSTSGEPLSKAEVTLIRHRAEPRLSYTATVADDGSFVLEDLEPGPYLLRGETERIHQRDPRL